MRSLSYWFHGVETLRASQLRCYLGCLFLVTDLGPIARLLIKMDDCSMVLDT